MDGLGGPVDGLAGLIHGFLFCYLVNHGGEPPPQKYPIYHDISCKAISFARFRRSILPASNTCIIFFVYTP